MSVHPPPRATRAIRAETAGSSGLARGPNQRGKGGGEVEASIPVIPPGGPYPVDLGGPPTGASAGREPVASGADVERSTPTYEDRGPRCLRSRGRRPPIARGRLRRRRVHRRSLVRQAMALRDARRAGTGAQS